MICRNRSEIESEIAKIFDLLESREITYCVLQETVESGLSYDTDIDLYVEKSDLSTFEYYLKTNAWIKNDSFRYKGVKVYYYKIIRGFKLKLDISTELGVFFNGNYSVYKYPIRYKYAHGIKHLEDDIAFLFIFKKALMKGGLNNERLMRLVNLAKKPQEYSLLNDFNEEKLVVENEYLNGKFDVIKKGRISYLIAVLAYLKRLTISRSSLTISFIGMDGAGKGTYIKKLLKNLEINNYTYKKVYLGHSDYQLGLVSFIAKQKDVCRHPWALKCLRFIYFITFPLELVYRRGYGVYDIVLTDRHPLFEPVFGSYRARKIYSFILNIVSPYPDKVIYLKGNTKTLWERKKEMPFEVYHKRSSELDCIVSRVECNMDVVHVDTDRETDVVYEEIWSEVFEGKKRDF